jgi:hypothetical protein
MNGAAAAASAEEQLEPIQFPMEVTFVQIQSRVCPGQGVVTQVTAHGGHPVGTCAVTRRAVRTIAAMNKDLNIFNRK